MKGLNLRQTVTAFAVAIATLAACQYESASNHQTPTTPTPRARPAPHVAPTTGTVQTSNVSVPLGAVMSATIAPSKAVTPMSLASRTTRSKATTNVRTGQGGLTNGRTIRATEVTPRNYTIGFNFQNVFADSEVVVYYERIGSGAMLAVGQYTVAQLTHHVFTAPPNCVAGTSGCVQFNALEIQRDFTVAQFAQPVETHLVSSSTGKSISAAGISVYQWGQ